METDKTTANEIARAEALDYDEIRQDLGSCKNSLVCQIFTGMIIAAGSVALFTAAIFFS